MAWTVMGYTCEENRYVDVREVVVADTPLEAKVAARKKHPNLNVSAIVRGVI